MTDLRTQPALDHGIAPSGSLERSFTLIDTSVCANNIGDSIIMDAVRRELADLLASVRNVTVPSHERWTRHSRSRIRESDFAVIGGTNCLSSRMWFRATWKLTPLDAWLVDNVVLMGCGWYQFQRRPDAYSRWMLRSVLSKDHVHSVRDSYSKEKLESIGIDNVVNTGCPTLWNLTPGHCDAIPVGKGDSVVTSLNTYFPDTKLDGALLTTLQKNYRKVYFWIQNPADYAYARRFGVDLIYLSPTVTALDEFLSSQSDLDYVGNRLHAGIRALQHGVRTLIVEVDNRAKMMGVDWGLPTVARDDFDRVTSWIGGSQRLELRLPFREIEDWKRQFSAWREA